MHVSFYKSYMCLTVSLLVCRKHTGLIFMRVCKVIFVSQHSASLGLARPARQSHFKMVPNKSMSSI